MQLSSYKWHLVWLVVLLVYCLGLFTPLLEVDEAEYACISREMLQTHQFTIIQKHGLNYLDKPPLLFWLSALSFYLFGLSEFAFKLPSVLLTFLSFYAVFRIGRILFNYETGKIAALLYASSLAVFLMNQDVRTDAILCSGICLAVWQILEFHQSGSWLNLLGSTLGISIAMLAKGPIGLMIPVIVLSTQCLATRSFGKLISLKLIAGLALLSLALLPMCIGLYQQYGIHGLQFYFWEQSFGRITGQNQWKNETDPFFFFHTFLWAFLPHSILFLSFLFSQFKNRFKSLQSSIIPIGAGFIIPLVVLSFSHYKLPHYINVILPFSSLLTAHYLQKNLLLPRLLIPFQFILLLAILVLTLFITLYLFPVYQPEFRILPALFLILIAIPFFRYSTLIESIVLPTGLIISISIGLLHLNFFPAISEYDGGKQMGLALKNYPYPVFTRNVTYYNAEFYSNKNILSLKTNELLLQKGRFKVLVNDSSLAQLIKYGSKPIQIQKFSHFSTSLLNWKFLNPSTRQEVLENRYLIEIQH